MNPYVAGYGWQFTFASIVPTNGNVFEKHVCPSEYVAVDSHTVGSEADG
jgi:hypothetical protein